MENLNFTKHGNWYVSEPAAGGESGIIMIHINFKAKPAKIIVERTFDESLGWAVVTSRSVGDNYEETITGVLGTTKVRIRIDEEATAAKYVSL